MDNYKNTWGQYSCNLDLDKKFVHPDFKDINYSEVVSYNVICKCIDYDGTYITIKSKNETVMKVKPDLYEVVAKELPFDFNDKVRTKTKSRTVGIIAEIGWHFKREEPLYYLLVDGKLKKTRYFAENLEKFEG